MVDFAKVAKRIFAVRSFKGQRPEVIKERFRLVTGLVRDVVDGKLSQETAMRLSREIADRLHEGGPLGPGPKLTAKQVKRGEKVLLAIFGSHAPIQHGRSRGPRTETQKGRRRNSPAGGGRSGRF